MKKGFTLIELLIVVAIIAILAAIAVPNFLEAQTRSKVSRSLSDIRTLATAVEAYAVDNNAYPIDGGKTGDGYGFWYVPDGPRQAGACAGVTSPIAYISSGHFVDQFRRIQEAATSRAADTPDGNLFTDDDYRRYRYRNPKYYFSNPTVQIGLTQWGNDFGAWVLSSSGPDKSYGPEYVPAGNTYGVNTPYDPTNGTISLGDIVRSQKDTTGKTMIP